MTTCCVVGCINRYSPSSNIKFYRIPGGRQPLHVYRKSLWVKAIAEANGSTEQIKANARICGAHFVSGEASHDTDNRDFVPSIFTTHTKKRKRRIYLRKKRRHLRHRRTDGEASETSSSRSESPVEFQTSDFVFVSKRKASNEETETAEATKSEESFEFRVPSPEQEVILQLNEMSPVVLLKPVIVPEGGYLCERCNQTFINVSDLVKHRCLHEEQSEESPEVLTEPPPVDAPPVLDAPSVQAVSSVSGTLVPDGLSVQGAPPVPDALSVQGAPPVPDALSVQGAPPVPDALSVQGAPSVLGTLVPDGLSVQGALPVQDAPSVQSAQSLPDVPSFPCNMCDRSFPTSRCLKRHKLLHVMDKRKCLQCGKLFCRRHINIFFQPQLEQKLECEEDSISSGEQDLDSSVCLKKMELSQVTETADKTPPTSALPQRPLIPALPSLLQTFCKSSNITKPVLVSVKPTHVPRPPSPIPTFPKSPDTLFPMKSPGPNQHPLSQHLEHPSSLGIFSPQYLTSALLDVQRNYEYILKRAKTIKIENIVKEGPEQPKEPVFLRPVEQTPKKTKREKIAYDLEIIL